MDITYTLRGIVFEWDSQKAATNLRKHGIGFELACEVFFDPFVRYVDEELIGEELREKAIGLTANWSMLYVVYVIRRDRIRIISARTVTKPERDFYEN